MSSESATSSESAIALTTSVREIPGVGPKRAAALERLGLRCAADLLLHIPTRYEQVHEQASIASAGEIVGPNHNAKANITVVGEIVAARVSRGRRSRFEATIEDGTGTLQAVWFNAAWLGRTLHPGMFVRLTGPGRRYGDYLQIVNPQWQRVDAAELESSDDDVAADEDMATNESQLRPIYPAGESLTSRQIESVIGRVLAPATQSLTDHLHADYRDHRALPDLATAYRTIHAPQQEDDHRAARRRLAFDELLLMQLGVMLKRRHRNDTLTAHELEFSEAIAEHIRARMPFTLTDDQNEVVSEIAADLQGSTPMNRLLQGDVGAGKTAVAVFAMLIAVASRHQTAFMAPTELLAEQHFESIARMLAGSNVTIELLTGSTPTPRRRDVLERLAAGEIDLLIGTHALLTEDVLFSSLALIVIDEQHRFGVHQRAALRSKSQDRSLAPHVLVMTATPIPRTLSLTVFGDLDVSTIRHLPPGRKPVITKHVHRAEAASVYQFLAKRVRNGEQGYIVVPAIDSDATTVVDLTSHQVRLAQGQLSNCRIEALHGRMNREQREEIMTRFRGGLIDVLIATTVIEVGVDVANATMMIIEDADRFGLAQLHQLRGRVGRSTAQSLCALIADPRTEEGQSRVAAMLDTGDGFVIAERDLEIRGPGDLFGLRQSGVPPFRVAALPGDIDLLRMARRDAKAWIDENPNLSGEREALLRRRLLKAHGQWLGLGDVA